MWRIIVGIYDGDPRLTNDRKRSHRVGKARKSSRRVSKARKWLGKVGNTRKHSESVQRGSSIGHECRNMRPEPGVAHHHHQCCCIATTGMGAMMTLSLSPSMARAVFLCARVVNGRRRRQVPTWPLLGCCLYLLFSSSFLLSSPFPTPHHFLPISLLQVRI